MSTFITEELFLEIRKALGRKNAFMLAGHYGGKTLHVPLVETLKKNPNHPLAEFLGLEDAIELAKLLPSFQFQKRTHLTT